MLPWDFRKKRSSSTSLSPLPEAFLSPVDLPFWYHCSAHLASLWGSLTSPFKPFLPGSPYCSPGDWLQRGAVMGLIGKPGDCIIGGHVNWYTFSRELVALCVKNLNNMGMLWCSNSTIRHLSWGNNQRSIESTNKCKKKRKEKKTKSKSF